MNDLIDVLHKLGEDFRILYTGLQDTIIEAVEEASKEQIKRKQ